MKRAAVLAAVGLGAYLITLLVTAPATSVLAMLQGGDRPHLHWQRAHGTVLAGSAEGVVLDGLDAVTLQWRWLPWDLLRGSLGYRIIVRDQQLDLTGLLRWDWRARLSLAQVQGRLPLERAARDLGQPALVEGRVEAALDRVDIGPDGRLVRAIGRVHLTDLRMAMGERARLGNVRVELEPGPEPVQARLEDDGGPLELDARLHLSAEGYYELQGRLGLRSDAPPELRRVAFVLGQPGADGYWRLETSGHIRQ